MSNVVVLLFPNLFGCMTIDVAVSVLIDAFVLLQPVYIIKPLTEYKYISEVAFAYELNLIRGNDTPEG